MDKVTGRLTVYFEDPFWIGVFEQISEGKLESIKNNMRMIILRCSMV